MTDLCYDVLRRYKNECNAIMREVGRGDEYDRRCDAIWKEKYEPEYIERRAQ